MPNLLDQLREQRATARREGDEILTRAATEGRRERRPHPHRRLPPRPPRRERRPAGRCPRRSAGKERRGSPRRIDTAVAAVKAHDRAAALAGTVRDSIYI
jgi:hypothetical protein